MNKPLEDVMEAIAAAREARMIVAQLRTQLPSTIEALQGALEQVDQAQKEELRRLGQLGPPG